MRSSLAGAVAPLIVPRQANLEKVVWITAEYGVELGGTERRCDSRLSRVRSRRSGIPDPGSQVTSRSAHQRHDAPNHRAGLVISSLQRWARWPSGASSPSPQRCHSRAGYAARVQASILPAFALPALCRRLSCPRASPPFLLSHLLDHPVITSSTLLLPLFVTIGTALDLA